MNTYRVPEIAKKYTEYDMIVTHTELPDFPESRIRLLFTFLKRSSAVSEQSELYSLVTSLVQMGMDTHDMVDQDNKKTDKAASRSRQLKVLAGDYFSSRFYQLLSQTGQIELVKLLSGAVCEVNRLKMSLYTRMKQLKMTAEEYIQHNVGIKSQLFLSFNKFMEDKYKSVWPEFLRAFTQCEVLLQEMGRSVKTQSFHGSWAYWHILQSGSKEERKRLNDDKLDAAHVHQVMDKYNVLPQLHEMLDGQVKNLLGVIRQFDSDKLKKDLMQLSEPFLQAVSAPIALKET